MTWTQVQGIAELAALLALAVAWGWGGGLLLQKVLQVRREHGWKGLLRRIREKEIRGWR